MISSERGPVGRSPHTVRRRGTSPEVGCLSRECTETVAIRCRPDWLKARATVAVSWSVDGGLRQRPGRSALPGGYLASEGVRTSKRIRSRDGSPGHRQLLCTETAAGGHYPPREDPACTRVGMVRDTPSGARAHWGSWNAGNGLGIRSAAVSWSVDGAAWMDTYGEMYSMSPIQPPPGRGIGYRAEAGNTQCTGRFMGTDCHEWGIPRAGIKPGHRQLLSSECGGSRKGISASRGRAQITSALAFFPSAGGTGAAGGTDSGEGNPGCTHPRVSRRRPRTTPNIPNRRDTTFSLRP